MFSWNSVTFCHILSMPIWVENLQRTWQWWHGKITPSTTTPTCSKVFHDFSALIRGLRCSVSSWTWQQGQDKIIPTTTTPHSLRGVPWLLLWHLHDFLQWEMSWKWWTHAAVNRHLSASSWTLWPIRARDAAWNNQSGLRMWCSYILTQILYKLNFIILTQILYKLNLSILTQILDKLN